jgi:hypothetical protein
LSKGSNFRTTTFGHSASRREAKIEVRWRLLLISNSSDCAGLPSNSLTVFDYPTGVENLLPTLR